LREDLASRALQVPQVVQMRLPQELRRGAAHEPIRIGVCIEQLVDETGELLSPLRSERDGGNAGRAHGRSPGSMRASALTSSAVSARPPMPQSPLATSATRHEMCVRMLSPSIRGHCVREPFDDLELLSSREHARDDGDLDQRHPVLRVRRFAMTTIVHPVDIRHIGQTPDIDPRTLRGHPYMRWSVAGQ
jgi:hypothetical protein